MSSSINHRYYNTSSSDNNPIAEATQTTAMWPSPPYAITDDGPPSRILNFNLNNHAVDDDEGSREHHRGIIVPPPCKEPLFQKPLTPSDVGKLNRLVIPKQHAEKYFPLNGDAGEKGLLLSFEDEVGKCWRFRYSYWNSSQSYVLTKGWSRFVKEKKLDAGDIVLFLRHRLDGGRMFIGWRRKVGGGAQPPNGVGSSWYYPQAGGSHSHSSSDYNNAHAASFGSNQSKKPVNSKTLRLFGVNLECEPTAEIDRSELSPPVGPHHGGQYHQYYNFYTNNYYTVLKPDI